MAPSPHTLRTYNKMKGPTRGGTSGLAGEQGKTTHKITKKRRIIVACMIVYIILTCFALDYAKKNTEYCITVKNWSQTIVECSKNRTYLEEKYEAYQRPKNIYPFEPGELTMAPDNLSVNLSWPGSPGG